ncbi:omega-hydroxypalmitate O-feruloyl transferase protein [Dioscorea alata]|uniref:Omega-hydroxypalmitate O-feruloyl transferase protein n=1 Tax=Dioscorea alata TaxID=55571 RepID=A0ACB7WBA9_DIOAL|nr:omega-hydroxypalmitate O-feruloyl transferase protein [Dioscorea alata]
MGSLSHQEQTLVNDLKVTILSSTKLYPLEKQERRSMFLSNIDQVLNFNVHTVHFFKKNTKFSIKNVVEKLKLALEKLLVAYDFLAGRLTFNNAEGRLEIDCNAEGVRFIVGSSELTLEDLGELDYPNPAFKQLAAEQAFDDCVEEKLDQPLCVFQVTSFKCGGFAMGVCNNHCTFDGISFQTFLTNLAAIAAGKPLAMPPCNDRRLLAARSPPTVKFPHPELIKLQPSSSSNSSMITCTNTKLNHKLFHLTSKDISTLKQKAQGCKYTITSFNVVAAHLWRCKALVSNTMKLSTDETSMLFAVNLRPRLKPPLPQSYTGNAVLSAWCSTTNKGLKEGSFKEVVEVVCEGGRRMDDEYARSVIDWGELYKGFPKGDVFVSSWWKLGFEEVVYPWGKPVYSCPVVVPSQDITVVFPAIGGVGEGVNVLVALPCELMDHYSTLFYDFLQ